MVKSAIDQGKREPDLLVGVDHFYPISIRPVEVPVEIARNGRPVLATLPLPLGTNRSAPMACADRKQSAGGREHHGQGQDRSNDCPAGASVLQVGGSDVLQLSV